MDLTTPLIFLSIFVAGSISLIFIYKYGYKKKSYEEVLAEQRRKTSAIINSYKPKPKEKKIKKAAKKLNKEKEKAITNSLPENNAPQENVGNTNVELNFAVVGNSQEEIKNPIEEIKSAEGKSNKAKAKSTNNNTNKQQGNKVHVEFKEKTEEVPVDVPTEKESSKELITKKRVKKIKPILLNKPSSESTTIINVALAEISEPVTNHFEEIHPKDEFEMKHDAISKEDVDNKVEASPAKEEKKAEKLSKKIKQLQKIENLGVNEKNNVTPSEEIAKDNIVEKEKLKVEKVVINSASASFQESSAGTSGKEKKKKKSDANCKQQIIAERDQLIHSVRNAELSRTEVQLMIDLLLNKQLEAPAVIDDWSEGKSDPVQRLKKQLAEKEKQLGDEQEALVGVQAKLKEVRMEQLTERNQLQLKLKTIEESKLEIIRNSQNLQQKIHELEESLAKERANSQIIINDNKALQFKSGQLEATLINYQDTENLIHTLKTENLHLTKQLQLLTQQRQEQDANYQTVLVQIQNMEMAHNYALTAQQEEARKVLEAHILEDTKLRELIDHLKIEIQKLQEKNVAYSNGSNEEHKEHEIKVLNLNNELSSVRTELKSINQNLLDTEKRYKTDLLNSQENFNQLKFELEEQKTKNNLIVSEIKIKEENAQKEFIQRLFPEIADLKSISLVDNNNWQNEYEKVIQNYIEELKVQREKISSSSADNVAEINKLQTEVQLYTKVLNEMEGMLKQLQFHIEQEERKWRNQLIEKDAEIELLKNQHISQLQVKVTKFESLLAEEHAKNLRLLNDDKNLNKLDVPEIKSVHADSIATIEKLSEEVNPIGDFINNEQTTNSEAEIYQNGSTS